MTLLIGGVNERFGVILSDRRLTSNSIVVDDEVNKMTAYFCRDAKVVFTFTGLARAGEFETGPWLSEFLVHHSEPERCYLPVRRRLVEALADRMRRVRASPEAKRLSILIVGYSYSEEKDMGRAILTRVSNFEKGAEVLAQARDVFQVEDSVPRLHESGDPYYLFTIAGTTRGIDKDMTNQLQELITTKASGRGVADKALELGIAASSSPSSKGAIGRSWSSGVIFSHPDDPIWVQYHSPAAVREQWSANMVDATGPHPVMGLSNIVVETKEPVVQSFPGTPRNAPCPCESDKKYKRCHGGSSSSRNGAYLNRLM